MTYVYTGSIYSIFLFILYFGVVFSEKLVFDVNSSVLFCNLPELGPPDCEFTNCFNEGFFDFFYNRGMWGVGTFPIFKLKLFVSRPKRFRHTTGKNKIKTAKKCKNTNFAKRMVIKFLICPRINFCHRFIAIFFMINFLSHIS